MIVELKNVVESKRLSEETTAYTGKLYIDGKFAAECSNHGQGAPDELHFEDRDVEARFYNYCKTLPPVVCDDGTTLVMDSDLFLAQLLDKYKDQQWFKKQCRRKTLFVLHGDEEGSYRTVNAKFEPEVESALVKKYGSKLKKIINKEIR
jgi:hypothetical protein